MVRGTVLWGSRCQSARRGRAGPAGSDRRHWSACSCSACSSGRAGTTAPPTCPGGPPGRRPGARATRPCSWPSTPRSTAWWSRCSRRSSARASRSRRRPVASGNSAFSYSQGVDLPDIWIPDSEMWLTRTFLGRASRFRIVDPPVASTPVLLVGGPRAARAPSWGAAETSDASAPRTRWPPPRGRSPSPPPSPRPTRWAARPTRRARSWCRSPRTTATGGRAASTSRCRSPRSPRTPAGSRSPPNRTWWVPRRGSGCGCSRRGPECPSSASRWPSPRGGRGRRDGRARPGRLPGHGPGHRPPARVRTARR